ncbi:MAG: TnpV protein [Bacilli bacterium]
MTIEYARVGDYYFPNIKGNNKITLSKYGKMKLKYLKEHQKGLYFELLSTNQLNSYLHNVDKEANEMYERLLTDIKKQRGISEELKAKNQMQWVQEMNNIQNCIEEVIIKKVIK